ncbi:HET-domain-containing protein [Hypoxylon crocopeplum]|nr:HET-domain-containing protein [Hypoxylon crocopeplum]
MPLCQRCEQKSDTKNHRFTFGYLKQTTCEFCTLVYKGIISILSPICPHDSASVTFPAFSDRNDNFQAHVFGHGIIVSFWCLWDTTCPWGILPTHRDITSLDSDGEGSFNTALDWIQNCVTHHGCSDHVLPALPTRVVATGLDGSPVRIMSGNSKRAHYMCLSHCWGQERPLMTTTRTLSSFTDQIPWSTIPTTFKDAISFARKLAIQYIWIDSLCIIQDSPEDWAAESSKMADIYRNSYVTIAATASKDSTGGLNPGGTRQQATSLKGRTALDKPFSIQCYYAMAPQTPAGEGTPNRVIQHPIPSISALEDFGETIPLFPLLTRGWVFQERLLSPRFLHFGRDELLWDCRETMLCECRQRPPDLPYNQVGMAKGDDLLTHKWRKFIEFYCSLSLTYQTDKLPALSGLARQMGEHRPGTSYLAGLWSDSLDLDLLWMPYGSEHAQEREYLSPSWSWACSSRRIIYPGKWRPEEKRPSVKVIETYFGLIEASCTARTVDPNGQVIDGHLKLAVPLFPLTVDPLLDNNHKCILRYENTPFFQNEGTRTDTNRRPSNWRQPFDFHNKRVFLDSTAVYDPLRSGKIYSCRLTRVEILEDSIYFLVMGARETVQIEFCLLLEQVDEGQNMFRRIGLLADGRVIDGHNGDAQSWLNEPSRLEAETKRVQITII